MHKDNMPDLFQYRIKIPNVQRDYKIETKSNVRCNGQNLEYKNSFIPKLVLTLKFGKLFKQQGFVMQALHKMHLLWYLIPEKSEIQYAK